MSKDKTKVTDSTVEETKETQETTEQDATEDALNREARDIAEGALEEADAEVLDEDAETEEEETSESSEESSASTETDEEKTEPSEEETEESVESFLEEEPEEEEHRSGERKRIDKLTAINKQKDENIARLEDQLALAKANTPEPAKDKTAPKYTKPQLNEAWDKAYADGDTGLMNLITEEREKLIKYELRKEYQDELTAKQEKQTKQQETWNNIVDSYSYLSGVELYPGSLEELKIEKADSLLSRVANALWTQNTDFYQSKPNGQQLAVRDALNRIIAKRKEEAAPSKKPAPKGKEVKKLERKVSKLKKKASGMGKVKSVKEELSTEKKPKSAHQSLEDEIATRKGRLGDNLDIL